jgi:hypothetical protein
MYKWIIALIFIISFPCAAFAQDNTSAMQTWVQQQFGINVPNPAISRSWEKMPGLKSCDYEWSLRWKDARFEVKDTNENLYRLSYDGDTMTLDFTRDFNGFFGG